MWYHLYLLYFLVAVVLTLVILIITLAEDTIIQSLLAGGTAVAVGDFNDSTMLTGLELQAGDKLIFGTSKTDDTGGTTTYNLVFELKKDGAVIEKTDSVTVNSPEATLEVPSTASNYTLSFNGTRTNSNNAANAAAADTLVFIEFIQLRRTKRILF